MQVSLHRQFSNHMLTILAEPSINQKKALVANFPVITHGSNASDSNLRLKI